MPLVKSEEGLTMGDLEEGKVFDGIELITDREDNSDLVNMSTARRVEDSDEIEINHYDIKFKGKKVKSINNNGYNELYPRDEGWSKYNQMLEGVNL